MRHLIGQFTRFGIVGLGGLAVDLIVFNALRLTVLTPEAVAEGPLIAKLVSTTLAIAANWIGNRLWTFRAHRGAQLAREGAKFVTASLGGMAIGLLCLWISHYVLGFTSVLADNIASNVVGLALGTLFRFTLYKYWVFPVASDERDQALPSASSTIAAATTSGEPTSRTTSRIG